MVRPEDTVDVGEEVRCPRTEIRRTESFVPGRSALNPVDFRVLIRLPEVLRMGEVVRQELCAEVFIDPEYIRQGLYPRVVSAVDHLAVKDQVNKAREAVRLQVREMLWKAFDVIVKESKLDQLHIFDEDEEPLVLPAGGLEKLYYNLLREKRKQEGP